MKVSDIDRDSGIEFTPQAMKELEGQAVPTNGAIADLLAFTDAWKSGVSQTVLDQRFTFKIAHHATCEKKGILLYEIYICRRKYRAIVAWFSIAGPGYWVAIFKKQGKQSTADTRTAGDRAVRRWEARADSGGNTYD